MSTPEMQRDVHPTNAGTLEQAPSAPSAVPPSETESLRFLDYYGGALEEGAGQLALFTLPNFHSRVTNDPQVIAEEAVRQAIAGQNVYLHVNLHSISQGRGNNQTASVAVGLFADIDAVGPGRKTDPRTLCPTVGDALWLCDEFNRRHAPLKIGLVIESGHGCYPVLLLKEPFVMMTPEDRRRFESFLRRFHQALQAIAVERGWTAAVDYCDLAKVLRFPGTINWKDKANPRPVIIAREDPARFNLAELEEFLPSLADVRHRTVEAQVALESTKMQIVLNPNAQVEPLLLETLRANLPQFDRTWNQRRSDLRDGSSSGYELSLAAMAAAGGLPEQVIADLLVQFRRDQFKGNKQDRRGQSYLSYIQRTILKAGASQHFAGIENLVGQAEDSPLAIQPTEPDANGQAAARSEEAELVESTRTEEARVPIAAQAAAGDAEAIEFLLAKVRSTPDPKIVFESVDLLARLDEARVQVVLHDLKTVLGGKLNKTGLVAAVKDARKRRIKAVKDIGTDGRPAIQVNDQLMDELTRQAIAALERANVPPVLFRRDGALVLVQCDEGGRARIMAGTDANIRGRLARSADFCKATSNSVTNVPPPLYLATDVRTCNEGNFPPLTMLTQTPIIRPDASLWVTPGYDPVSHAFYQPAPDFRLGAVPEWPTQTDARDAVKLLQDLIADFPFESAADRANSLGVMLTPILRAGWRMYTPLALIDATKWGTGKTLLASLVYIIATGAEPSVCSAPTAEEEWRKRVMSILEAGDQVVIIDNITQRLQSPALCAVMTSSNSSDRLLGKANQVSYPNVSTWIVTGNNVVMGGEIGRRAYRIRLDAKTANPAKRTGFKRPDQELLNWTLANRGALVGALLTMVRAWLRADCPKADVPTLGSFTVWAGMVGGILHYAGVEGFLTNIDALQAEADEESGQWEHFLNMLRMIFGSRIFTSGEVVQEGGGGYGTLAVSFPDEVGLPAESGGKSEFTSFSKRLGKALAGKCGTRFGEQGLRIEKADKDPHTKVQRWRLVADDPAVFDAVSE